MTAREVLGRALVGVGVVGVILPIVPGWPFLLAAVAVLGPDHRLTRPFVGLVQRGRSLVRTGSAKVTTPVPDATPSPDTTPAPTKENNKRRRRRPMHNVEGR